MCSLQEKSSIFSTHLRVSGKRRLFLTSLLLERYLCEDLNKGNMLLLFESKHCRPLSCRTHNSEINLSIQFSSHSFFVIYAIIRTSLLEFCLYSTTNVCLKASNYVPLLWFRLSSREFQGHLIVVCSWRGIQVTGSEWDKWHLDPQTSHMGLRPLTGV